MGVTNFCYKKKLNPEKSRLIRCHEEAVHVIGFSPDSNILLTGCMLGNIRMHYADVANENMSVVSGSCSRNILN